MQVTSGGPDQNPVEEFRRNLRVMEREIVRQLAQETGCCGVTLAQCHALLELSRSELSLTALAAALDLDISTLSRTVEGMVRCGFVERTEDSADRRSVCLQLTGAGRRKVTTIDKMCNQYYGGLLGELAEKDQRCVIRAVRLLAELMRRERTSGSGGCCGTEDSRGQANPRTIRRLKDNE
jgi:DNA-binding MarR family transcriptional regulator